MSQQRSERWEPEEELATPSDLRLFARAIRSGWPVGRRKLERGLGYCKTIAKREPEKHQPEMVSAAQAVLDAQTKRERKLGAGAGKTVQSHLAQRRKVDATSALERGAP